MTPGSVCVAFAVVIGLATPLAAQSHPLVGTWDISIQAGIHEVEGKVNPVMARGTVTFSVAGDSLIAVLTHELMASRPPVRFATILSGDTARFVRQAGRLRTKDNSMGTETILLLHRFVVRHDSLIGRIDAIDDVSAKESKYNNWPVTGVRAKSP